jgi:hypothetical protein
MVAWRQMMQRLSMVGVVSLVAVTAFVFTKEQQGVLQQCAKTSEGRMSNKVDVDLDEESAIKVAEIILVRVYGKAVLNERPWNVTKKEHIFKIEGTLNTPLGGVATIEINQSNAEVMSIVHGK